MAYRIQLTILGAFFVGACGLDIVGTGAPLDGSAPEPTLEAGAPLDDGAPTVVDSGPPVEAGGCSSSCTATTAKDPTFTNVVLFGDTSATCPSDFATADVIENPVAHANACGCSACTATANCNSGSLANSNSDSAGCMTGSGAPLDTNGGTCKSSGPAWGHTYEAFAAPAAVGPQGSATPVPNDAGVDLPKKRMCTPKPGVCAGEACGAAPFKACIEVDSSQAQCPAGFTDRHLVSDDITLTCGACTVTNPAVTCGGTATYYASNDCSGGGKPIPANTCTKVNGDAFGSYKWVGTIATQSCTAMPGAPKIDPKGVKTICCP